MNARATIRSAALALLIGGALGGCVAAGYGDGGAGVGVGYAGDYYEPYGYDYGGWGPGYYVGPPDRHGHDWDRDHGHDHDHAFGHGGGRPPPSIPDHPRPGGHSGGGGHGASFGGSPIPGTGDSHHH